MTTPAGPPVPEAPHPAPEDIWSGTPNVILDGQRYAIGWQRYPADKGGPAYVTLRRGILGGRKVLDRYPLTDDGWFLAWTAFARLDPAVATKTRAVLVKDEIPANQSHHREPIPPYRQPAYWVPSMYGVQPPHWAPQAYGVAPPYWVPPRMPRRDFPAWVPAVVGGGVIVLALFVYAAYMYIAGPSSNLAYETKVAISRSASGQYTIYELACPGEWVQQVDLILDDSQGNDLTTLWEIRSSAPTTVSQFTVGESPPGFRMVRNRTAIMKPGDELEVHITVNWGTTFFKLFDPGDARRGSLYLPVGPNYFTSSFSGLRVSVAKFRSARNLVCENEKYPFLGG